jgi:hypothetical protein
MSKPSDGRIEVYIGVGCRGGQSWWETIGWDPANGSGRVVEVEERERAVYRERVWSGCNLALERVSLKDRDGINVVGKWPRVGRRAELSWEGYICPWPVPSLSSLTTTGHLDNRHLYKPRSFRRSDYSSLMMEAVRTSETSADNHSTWQYNPEDSSEHQYNVWLQTWRRGAIPGRGKDFSF